MITIKAFDINDADLESGVAQARAAYNAKAKDPVQDDATYAGILALATFEAFRGASKRALEAKVAQLDPRDVADVVAVVDAKLSVHSVPAGEIEPIDPIGVRVP